MSNGDEDDHAGALAGLYQRTAAAGTGAKLGVGIGGSAGVIAGASLGILLEPLAAKVWGELRGDAQRRQGDTLAAAQEAIGGDPAELERLIRSSDESRLQGGIALSAATRTAWAPKVRALGRALAAGLLATDDARIDTEPLIMAALAGIEFPQASLLELLVCHWPATTTEGLAAERFTAPASTTWTAGQRIWLPGDITLVRPSLRPVLPSLLGTLQHHGLAAQSDDPGDPFGRTGRTMQQRFLGDLALEHGSRANLGAVEGHAPAGSWLPTELGEEVLNALMEAGAEFAG
jgi:hypothetical protein